MTDPAVPGDQGSGWEPTSAELSAGLSRQSDPQVGAAYAVNVRTDADPRNQTLHQTVLTFRLRRLGPDGRDLPPVAVEMRGPVLTGMVAEGDLVRLPAPVPHGGALQLTTVTNLTTQTVVTARSTSAPTWVKVVVLSVFAVMFLAVLGFVIIGTLTMGSP